MRPFCKKVAVVGGGIFGIFSVKWLKAEGIEPVCFEKCNEFGGIWVYREEDIEGLPSVMSTSTLNHSKEFSSMPDFLIPDDAPNYLGHSEMLNYLKSYVEKFNLSPHIFCNKEVIHIERTKDYEETGRWSVCVKDITNGNIITEIFDGVLVCVGQICFPKMAEYPGMDKYSGKIMHTHSLKRFREFTGQRVTVVGTGCSALDAAVEISNVAKQVYLSVRTPSWIISRQGPYGLPSDYAIIRRYITFFQKVLPLSVASWILEKYLADAKFSHNLYGIEPKYPFLTRDPIVSDELASKIISGAIVLRKNIQYFTQDGVVFEGEKKKTTTDTVIMATGYTWKFDFLEKGVVRMEEGKFNLYKCMYPAHLKHPTLAIIGFVLPIGPGFPIGELQVRWAVYLLANGKELPNKKVMLQDAMNRYEANCKRYSPSEKRALRVDFVPYMDELAKELGVMPNFWKMAFTDPRLFSACIFGPCIPSQYRLEGPHKFEKAREVILTSRKRMQTPLSAERLQEQEGSYSKAHVLINIFIPLVIVYILIYKDSPLKYYSGTFVIFLYLIFSKKFIKYFFVATLLPFFMNWHGLAALYILLIAAFIYLNLGSILVNRYFWT